MTKHNSLYFIDPTCPRAFDFSDLKKEAIAGTEASTLRVAKALSEKGIEVTLFQKNRTVEHTDPFNLTYKPLSALKSAQSPTYAVLIRKRRWLSKINSLFPKAKKFYWLHEFVHSSLLLSRYTLRNWTVLGVSKTHAKQITATGSSALLDTFFGKLKVESIHNSICVDEYDGLSEPVPIKEELKLVFFSSPHKGLDQVLEVFQAVKEKIANANLYIANPGYIDSEHGLPAGVVSLGALSKKDLYSHVASAFCVFYPQTKFAETFGLVYAEANTLGTPVLCADLGAAREILSNPEGQIVSPATTDGFVCRLEGWIKQGRPKISPQTFAIEDIVMEWLALLRL